jgi:hypothetical protein
MVHGVDIAGHVIVAAGTDVTNPAIWGPGAALVAAFLGRIIVPGWLYSRSEKENDRLRIIIEDRVIPALERSNDVLSQALELLARHETAKSPPRKTQR